MIREISIHFPGRIIFGCGTQNQLREVMKAWPGTRLFIVTIDPLLPVLEEIFNSLRATGYTILVDTGIVQEPYFSHFHELMKKAVPFKPDIVIGIGGGSVLDMAKLVAAQLDNEQQLSDYVGIGLLKGRKKPLVCMPATSGTGSEVSPNAILVDDADGQKKGIISPYLVPDVVIADPLLTLSVPASITAATGIDALTHCMEAYTNKFAHPVIDLYALEGMRLIAQHLVRAVKNGHDEEARTAVALGSLYGGLCLGPVNTAAVHALSYPLGSEFHLPHGLSNALLLPFVMEYNIAAAPQRYAEVARALGCSGEEDDSAMAREGVNKVRELIRDCGLPLQLRAAGVHEAAIPGMAAAAMKIQRLLKNNPRPVSEHDAIEIYKAAY